MDTSKRRFEIWIVLGTASILISSFADDLGLGAHPGFGAMQAAGLTLGLAIVAAGAVGAMFGAGPRRRLAAIVGLGLAAAAALYLLHHALFWWNAAVVDDAYITLRYAWMLVAGHPGQYNVGETVEGYSSLSWVLLESIPIALHADPVRWTKITGLGFGVLTILMTYGLSIQRRPGAHLQAAFAAALVATNAYFASWTMFGMETIPYAFALLLFVTWYESDRLRMWAAPLVVLLCMPRPESPLPVAPVLLVELRRWWRGQASLRFLLAALIPVAVYYAGHCAMFGSLFPNTFYAKVPLGWDSVLALHRVGARYALDFFSPRTAQGMLLLGGLLCMLLTGQLWRSSSRPCRPCSSMR
jgi:hypothetical protein